jgi:hypothetical protein
MARDAGNNAKALEDALEAIKLDETSIKVRCGCGLIRRGGRRGFADRNRGEQKSATLDS